MAWVAFRLTDNDGDPVASERYSITLPDGSVREGRLDDQGQARIEDVPAGDCQVEFPDLLEGTWEPEQVRTGEMSQLRLVSGLVRVLTYNTHLYGGVLFGFNTFADTARARLFADSIRNDSRRPDVVGLCEVWDRELADRIARSLADVYPHVAYGPFNEDNIEQALRLATALGIRTGSQVEENAREDDGPVPILQGIGAGLLAAATVMGGIVALNELGVLNSIGCGLMLLSRWPFVGEPWFHTYEHETGFPEKLSQKGALVAAVEHPETGRTLGVMLSHTQSEDIEAATRQEQIREVAALRDAFLAANPGSPLLIMGDLNVPAEYGENPTGEYGTLTGTLAPMIETYRDLNPEVPPAEWVTNDVVGNRLANHLEPPEPSNHHTANRYDYVFFTPDSLEAKAYKVVRYQADPGFSDAGTPAGRVMRHLAQLLGEELIALPLGDLFGPGDRTFVDLSDHYGLFAKFRLRR